MKKKAHDTGHGSLYLFSGTLFLSAALMFAVQPMAGKMLLPLVGGAPTGWIVALAFFQIMLLLGYLYAHLLSRFSPLLHGLLYVAALGCGCLLLPLRLPEHVAQTYGAGDVFWLLAKTLAVPFVALSATSSTIQRLFTGTRHKSAEDPYFLYAASNLGSFTGLFLYPLMFEQLWGLREQTAYWFCGYGALIAAALLCLCGVDRKALTKAPKQSHAAPATNQQRLHWVALSFFPSALLTAVTTHISTDIFSAPMLWVLPLALYLLTFVVAFSRKQIVPLDRLAALQPVIVALALGFLLMFHTIIRVSWRGMLVHLVAFTAIALMCHILLAKSRPLKNERRLTEFYLMMSLGGALGGILNAFIVPVMLNRLVEYPVLLALSCLVNPAFNKTVPFRAKVAAGVAGLCTLMYTSYVIGAAGFINTLTAAIPGFGIIFCDVMLFVILFLLATSLRTVLLGGLVMIFLSVYVLPEFETPKEILLVRRNFYGAIKVADYPMQIHDRNYVVRYLYHGTTTHGMQILDPKYETTPTAYFTRGGPVGDVFNFYNPKNIAVIGLGAGTMNCFSNAENAFTFIEIDPAVVETANDPKLFTFMSACKAKRPPRFITGDGRLELAKLEEKFDMIILDAFASDTIPAHLLTQEAMKVYLDHLNPQGLVLFNLTNRYFDLGAVLARNAIDLNMKYRFALDIPSQDIPYASASRWFVMARQGVSLQPLSDVSGWFTAPPPEGVRPWTDDYTNLISVLQFLHAPVKATDP